MYFPDKIQHLHSSLPTERSTMLNTIAEQATEPPASGQAKETRAENQEKHNKHTIHCRKADQDGPMIDSAKSHDHPSTDASVFALPPTKIHDGRLFRKVG
ncbi:hypothetical protein CC80DRAFT_492255 [Byssothecium circinans]|uniref:Uncharacterized protein n=1 Tax=Byssothecium circinans TaxID=147558 RepID=A0A6A5U6L1_9PLEO|nr:hypothetical protein CC80DRAFT_492255 [Byssothecium circinans]